MAVISFLFCIIVLLIPLAVNIVCPDNTPAQWSRLFLGISVIVVASNIPFVFLARSEPAPWTKNQIHELPRKTDAVQIGDMTSNSVQQRF
ncbi:hypothetical protein GCK32_003507 [Trichostrongylus colubriformis]|uniref:Uncharacterized protein n=1 Tax=Trichostrongylus colubriformis TaxID=6319 RepID=A0AAN8F4M9_TRICO